MTNINSIIKHEQYKYTFNENACHSCGGACCRGESGYIWTKYQEMQNIATFLDMNLETFTQNYIKKVKHRYSLVEKKISEDDYACIFFDTEKLQCSIYPVRPLQCRTFPFWEQFKNNQEEVRRECPGII